VSSRDRTPRAAVVRQCVIDTAVREAASVASAASIKASQGDEVIQARACLNIVAMAANLINAG